MKRLLPILLYLLALAVPQLYGQNEMTYPVTFSANEGGSISVTALNPWAEVHSGDLVAAGSNLSISGVIDEGYQLDYWEVNGVRKDITDYYFSIDNLQAPLNIVGHFKEAPADGYAIHYSTVGDAEVTASYLAGGAYWDITEVNDGDKVPAGTRVSFEIVPAGDKVVGDWTINGKVMTELYGKKSVVYTVIAETTLSVEIVDPVYHKLTYEATEGGSLSAMDAVWNQFNSGDSVKRGTVVSFSPSFKDEYKLDHWEINGEVFPHNPKQANIDYQVMGDTHVKLFARLKDKYIVNFSAEANGAVAAFVKNKEIISGSEVTEEADVILHANPDEGYQLLAWTLDGDTIGKENILIYTVKREESDIVAHFTEGGDENKFPLHFSSNEGGDILAQMTIYSPKYMQIPLKDGFPIAKDSRVEFIAQPEELYMVKSWTVNGEIQEYYNGRNLFSHNFYSEDTIRVEFERFTPGVITFDASPEEGGYVQVKDRNWDTVESGGVVPINTKISISAYEVEGYVFDYWEIDGIRSEEYKSSRIYDYVVTQDVSFKAIFRQLANMVVTFSADGEGSVSGGIRWGRDITSGESFLEGTTLRFTAEAEADNELRDWTINGEIQEEGKTTIDYTVLANKENTIVANFVSTAAAKAEVTFSHDGEGTLSCTANVDGSSITSGSSIEIGKVLTFVATPSTDYMVSGWTINGEELYPEQTTIEYTVVEGRNDIMVHFEMETTIEEYLVTFSATPAEAGTVTGEYFDQNFQGYSMNSGDKLPSGTWVTFTATANDGYELEKWIINGKEMPLGVEQPNQKLYVIIEDAVVEAVFKRIQPTSYPLTLTTTTGGSIVAKVGGTTIASGSEVVAGSSVIIESIADKGYELIKLTANERDILGAKSFEMSEAIEVKATFAKKTFAVKLQSNEHGTISIVEAVDLTAVPYGTKLTVKAEGNNDECKLTKLTANDKDILMDKTFTVTAEVTVVAEFVDHTALDAVTTTSFSIYPNPAKEYAVVTGLTPDATVTLYTLEGQMIQSLCADHSGSVQIELTALSDGTYLVVTESSSQRLVIKH